MSLMSLMGLMRACFFQSVLSFLSVLSVSAWILIFLKHIIHVDTGASTFNRETLRGLNESVFAKSIG